MVRALQYKGYVGSVLYSAEDKVLHGRVLGIRDMISYGGTGVRSLEKNFRDAVDEYMAFCAAEGKTPDAPFMNLQCSDSAGPASAGGAVCGGA
jgi:predicted HicB family RNase H-like nuclease